MKNKRKDTYVFSHTSPGTSAKLEYVPIHDRGVRMESSLRNEVIRILPKDVSIAVHNCSVDAHPRSRREVPPGNLAAASRYIAW
jgi:hypothetical protein